MVKDVLQQRHVVVAASWSPFEVLIHQDQITQSTFLAPDPFSFPLVYTGHDSTPNTIQTAAKSRVDRASTDAGSVEATA